MRLLLKSFQAKLDSLVSFAGNIQPGEATSPNTADKQVNGVQPYRLKDKDKEELQRYREARRRERREERETVETKGKVMILPERLKKQMKRQRNIKQDDISPTVS